MSTTVSTRRDGRTEATVPDGVIREEIAWLFAEAKRLKRCRPTIRHISERMGHRGCRVGASRIEANLAAMEAAGELPVLRLSMQQQGARVKAASLLARPVKPALEGYWPDRNRQQRAQDEAAIEAARLDRERAFRGQERPAPAEPTVRELARMVRAAERRLGLGARKEMRHGTVGDSRVAV